MMPGLFLIACAPTLHDKSVGQRTAPTRSPIEKAIARYQSIAKQGGWPHIPEGRKWQLGDLGEEIYLLKERLKVTGDMASSTRGDKNLFDENLLEGVKRFQQRHGIEPDGIVGKSTLEALNVPVEFRLRQLEVNAERQREEKWRGSEMAFVVNIPDFSLKLFEKDKVALQMKVVVGKTKDWQTPLLDTAVRTIVINPQWNVPPGIFEKEVIHELRKNPDYLTKHRLNIVSLDRSTLPGSETQAFQDPSTIDWSRVSPKNPRLRLVQKEGAGNSLGRLKFLFPNPYDVYLHDTPEKSLFARPMRAFSHGCVRVEKPFELAEKLLKDSPYGDRARLDAAVRTGKTRYVPLPSPVPIHLIYKTAWVDDDGTVNFRADIYRKD